jgi:Fe2+ or Zn2+ uptake regulation protein
MDIREIIKKAGLVATPQRIIVYGLMQKLCHSSIDVITSKVQQKNSEITVSTVYRILDTFCEAGLLSKIPHPNGKWFYDIRPSNHHHVFTNNEVIDYIDVELTELIKSNLKGELFNKLNIEKITVNIVASQK